MKQNKPLNLVILKPSPVDPVEKGGPFFPEALQLRGHNPIPVDQADIDVEALDRGWLITKSDGNRRRLDTIDGVLCRISPYRGGGDPYGAITGFRNQGIYTSETVEALQNVESKIRSAELFEEHSVPAPKTIGLTAEAIAREPIEEAFRQFTESGVVLKADNGLRGIQVHFPESPEEAFTIAEGYKAQGKAILLQERIHSLGNSTLRVNIAGGRIVNTGRQYPAEGAIVSNLGDVEVITLSSEQQEVALKAYHAVGLHFSGIDMIESVKTGKTYVLEANLTPAVNFFHTSLCAKDKERYGTSLQDAMINTVTDSFIANVRQHQQQQRLERSGAFVAK